MKKMSALLFFLPALVPLNKFMVFVYQVFIPALESHILNVDIIRVVFVAIGA